MERQTHTIDVKDKVLGRTATQVALLLRGKNEPGFAPHKDAGCMVIIKNINQIRVTGKKYSKKIYYRHSGYLGGLKEISYKELFKRDPKEVLKRAVYGMLPKNKLRAVQIKRLKFE